MHFSVSLALVAALALAGCATTPSRIADLQGPSPLAKPGGASSSETRNPASGGELFWIDNPCRGRKGKPFNSYHSFALDEYAGVIYARKSASAQPQARREMPQGKVAWESVTEFLAAQGISAACPAGAVVVDPVPGGPANPRPSRPPRSGGGEGEERDFRLPPDLPFAEPVNFDRSLYYRALESATESGTSYKHRLHWFLASPHVQAPGQPDEVVAACPAELPEGKVCVTQKKLDYKGARTLMFGDVDLRETNGAYEVFDVYCNKWMGAADFAGVTTNPRELPGPGHIVHSRKMNCEHTWPQSKFPSPKGSAANLMEKTDLHHIFPSDSKLNSVRGNHDFAEVDPATGKELYCAGETNRSAEVMSRFGDAKPVEGVEAEPGAKFYEPPSAHKGNVARALFYFSARYNAGMSAMQEHWLRKWHREDPPDETEIARNEKVYRLIGVRNPFIDDPSIADRVSRFCRVRIAQDQAPSKYDCQSP